MRGKIILVKKMAGSACYVADIGYVRVIRGVEMG